MAAITTPRAVAHRKPTSPSCHARAQVRPRFAPSRAGTLGQRSGAEHRLIRPSLRRRCGPATLGARACHRQPCPTGTVSRRPAAGSNAPRRPATFPFAAIPARCRWRRAAGAVPPRTPPAVDHMGREFGDGPSRHSGHPGRAPSRRDAPAARLPAGMRWPGRSVRSQSSASPQGDSATACSTPTALSRTLDTAMPSRQRS